MITKIGATLQILRQGSLETVAKGRAVQERQSSVPVNNEGFLYFATKAIAGDIPNGNGDYFPWDHLLKSYATFVGRNLFLNHNSGDPRNAIGKVLDAYPVVDEQSGEKYIECLAKIDRVAHPDLARQIEAGILDSVSMGCSVESSQCSVCGTTIYSDQDSRCQHMSRGLGKEFHAELDLPEFSIKKGSPVKAFAINRGLNFTELSVVNVPAWSNAKIVQVIAQLKESAPEAANDLEEILKMASKNLQTEATEAAASPAVETPAPAASITEEEKSRESRLTRLFKEKLSALDFMDLQAFMKKETEKTAGKAEATEAAPKTEEVKKEEVAPEAAVTATAAAEAAPVASTTPVEEKTEAKTEEVKVEAASAPEMAAEKKDADDLAKAEKNLAEASKLVEEVKEHEEKELADMKSEATQKEAAASSAELEKTDAPAEGGRKLKAIFVSKADVKDSYWVVTDDGKPVLKATLSDTWGDNLQEVADYATSPIYGEALLKRLCEDGIKKVALATNATIYTEAADARGQVGKGEMWPSQKSVGKDQYTPAGPESKAKMKKLPEGIDMSGGDHGAGSAGASGGKGDQYPTSKSVGKSQYKPGGYGGGPKVKTEKASSEDTEGKIEVTAAPAEAPAMEMPPMDAPAAEAPKDEGMAAEAPKGDMKPLAEMSDEEKLEWMSQALDAMQPGDKMKKPLDGVRKALEKLDAAMAKQQEADAKEAEKAAKEEAKEAEKAAKEAEKAAEKDAKADKSEDKKESKDEKKEDSKDEKKDEGKDKEDKKEDKMPEGLKKEAEAAPAPEATVELDLPAPSQRERELEAQLNQLKLEQALRAKTAKCQSIVSEMVEKDMLAADESDIQEEIANGKPLFDARAAAFKKAIDKQCRDLLAMDDSSLQAFAMTVKRVRGRSIPSSNGVLKKAFKLQFDGQSTEDVWLGDVFNQMGSQKGRNLE